MTDYDFKECEFITSKLRFFTFTDFCDNCDIIKSRFEELPYNGKKFYMWYIFANTHMDNRYKTAIWDYLNDYVKREDLFYLKLFYVIK